ncbi:terminase ATPase subunit family protein [Burkholderia cenocepacia]|uniref:Terminase ATPase subunit family protein n=1 Tax=Burkholderia cenocepacia TaxID=95486 RepID=A0ABD4URI9_9BURK|nr:terminase ATPase subunit family protein [Burkholderia cenocepacia]MCW3700792.1 terminase ATPase subunit family protein [Burkholderia cenocepacia]MCW3708725.1 terminase ATPase subunit family protein [Burkholderia cenocepacia]MCW3716727.1 terminase ATPase subunit family protein [Burkholderia cenocepacia]MCW3724745.1 terminase ATPase subunit family protein [Burkholderia cenocepacia]MCW3732769.1 terminase ATPase subunit family protein [Burkholderia cenocepacia]
MLETTDPIQREANVRQIARSLYWQGWRISSIARHLEQKPATVASWCRRDKWKDATPIERIEAAAETRPMVLIAKDKKDGADYKEIDLLGRQIERLARVQKYGETGKEGDLNPNIAARNAGPKRKPPRNEISEEQEERIVKAFRESLFDYQKVWYRNGDQQTRNILKSRQIGATWYFAREAFVDALDTGRNQIFLSASKAQAHVFKQYIVQFARDVADVELTGDPIILPNGATLYFLGTNSRTAQSYHGNLYFDEYFWVPKFRELNTVASGMAMHKRWRLTYFSTPSSTTHEAYAFWSGADANRGRAPGDRIQIDTSHEALVRGMLGEDEQWRQIVTVLDAIEGGCDLFDLERLRRRYSAEAFANLLMCQFIDDSVSVFKLAELQRCMVDSWEEWADDFSPLLLRPFGYREVWVGYDPALTGDSAGLVVVAPPRVEGGAFRVLERHQFRGNDFEEQAAAIEQITQRYNVGYIAIDTTGMGQGVYQLVRKFYPAAVALNYSPEVKTRLVLKGQSVIRNGRLQFDAGWTDLAAAFMGIKQTMTASGRHATYTADRNEETGHADLAWACLHAIDREPLAGGDSNSSSFTEFYS